LSSGEGFGWGGGEACASEAMRGVAESGEYFGAAGNHFDGAWRHEKVIFKEI